MKGRSLGRGEGWNGASGASRPAQSGGEVCSRKTFHWQHLCHLG